MVTIIGTAGSQTWMEHIALCWHELGDKRAVLLV